LKQRRWSRNASSRNSGRKFCRFVFLKKRTCARVFGLTRFTIGSRSRRVTHDDSVQIAATSPARRRGRLRAATRGSVGLQSMRDVVVPADRPAAQNAGSASRPRRKFSALQSIENSQNGEGISILREAVPWAGGTPCVKEEGAKRGWRGSRAGRSRPGSRVGGDAEPIVDLSSRGASVAGIAAREADGKPGVARKWRRNDLKTLNPRPEMVWPRRRRTHKIWYWGARPTVRKNDKVGRKLSALRNLENSESRPRAEFPGGRICSHAR
jgi:hypothetical protein